LPFLPVPAIRGGLKFGRVDIQNAAIFRLLVPRYRYEWNSALLWVA
jgi:hypothetical protein